MRRTAGDGPALRGTRRRRARWVRRQLGFKVELSPEQVRAIAAWSASPTEARDRDLRRDRRGGVVTGPLTFLLVLLLLGLAFLIWLHFASGGRL